MSIDPEIAEVIENAVLDMAGNKSGFDTSKGRKKPPLTVEIATDFLRRFAENAPSGMTMVDLLDELNHGNRQY